MNITADGTYTLKILPGRGHTLMLAGTFGGGSIALSMVDSASLVELALPDCSAITAATGFAFDAGADTLKVVVTGSTSPDLQLIVTPMPS